MFLTVFTNPISVLKAHEEELKHRVLHSLPVTPVNVKRLEFLWHGYNPASTQYLIEGFSLGFRINFVAERCAMDSRMVVGERRAMYSPLVGPFATPPFSNFRTSPIGLVP